MDRWASRRDKARQPEHRRTGHRWELEPSRERRSFAERKDRALADIGVYRVVAVRDLSKTQFDGHPFTTRRAIGEMVRQGFVQEHSAKGPKGGRFKVLTVTERGAERARDLANKYGLAKQRTWAGLEKLRDAPHDVAVYRAAQKERRMLLSRALVVHRVRIDAELKRELARASGRAQAQGPEHAAAARRAAARRLGLPVKRGRVKLPDAQLEYRDANGEIGRVNIEVASDHYSERTIAAKAAAGFSVHAVTGGRGGGGGKGGTRSAGRLLARIANALGRAAGSGSRSGGARHRGRAGGSIEL